MIAAAWLLALGPAGEALAPTAVEAPPVTSAPAEPAAPEAAPAAAPPPVASAQPGSLETMTVEPAGAIGSDEPPLPPAPPAASGRIRRGPWHGHGWVGLGGSLEGGFGLPRGRRVLTAGLQLEVGARPHRVFSLFSRVSVWGGNVERHRVLDTSGEPVVVAASTTMNAWDLLGTRLFVPLPGRIEPFAELSSGFAVERRPYDPRRAWGTMRLGGGISIWLAPMVSIEVQGTWRLLARRTEIRHYVGGLGGLSVHF